MTDPIRPGGLFRCCVQTLRDRVERAREGDTQTCQVGEGCVTMMVFRDKAWEWQRPAAT